ncbi:double zinc ribbon domain-containing protein [Paracidovorax konjaci]|uniref:double zinc ribbon domain-containing protein n=1 Tax=Paracidovorax konjaci TaxID=32040 RepID=UPI001FEA369B|nr:zinc ribbon domain-containing protein [Paracidovorax konjaci]
MPPGGSNGGSNCPNCRTLNAGNARFCQQCGTSMVPARCAHCGTSMQMGAKFCGQCGKAPA